MPVALNMQWSTLPFVSLLLPMAVGALSLVPHWRIGRLSPVALLNLNPDSRNGLSADPIGGAYAIPGCAVVVIMVLAEPAPIRLMPFVMFSVLFQVAEPAGTFMVSPLAAFCIASLIHSQVAFLAVQLLGPLGIGLPALHDVPQDTKASDDGVDDCDGVEDCDGVDIDII